MDYAGRTADDGQAANPIDARTVDGLHNRCISLHIGATGNVVTHVAPGGMRTCSGPGLSRRLGFHMGPARHASLHSRHLALAPWQKGRL
eukprot:11157412-Lingulodinium_polyedra.AAC.1